LLEGIGAALILPAIVALVASNFGPERRTAAYGMIAAARPIIGGAATTFFSWRWVFAGDVVVGLAILLFSKRLAEVRASQRARIDLVGALSSQLGAVTVSALPNERSAEVGGLQNTATNLGASLGTALVGSVLIATLTATAVAGLQESPDVPEDIKNAASAELAGGVQFVSDKDLRALLETAMLSPAVEQAVLETNDAARLVALRAALTVVALVALVSLFFTSGIPARAVGGEQRLTDSDPQPG
jgi:hypothetical protein